MGKTENKTSIYKTISGSSHRSVNNGFICLYFLRVVGQDRSNGSSMSPPAAFGLLHLISSGSSSDKQRLELLAKSSFGKLSSLSSDLAS